MSNLSALEIKAFNNLIAAEFPINKVRSFCGMIQENMAKFLNKNAAQNGCVFTVEMAGITTEWLEQCGLSIELALYIAAYNLLQVQDTCYMYPQIALMMNNIRIDAVKRDGSICFAW
jgi:hypothetical protein